MYIYTYVRVCVCMYEENKQYAYPVEISPSTAKGHILCWHIISSHSAIYEHLHKMYRCFLILRTGF